MNAVQQSAPGGAIVVAVTEHADGRAVISVTGRRPAASTPADLGRVFEPGWRGTEPRTPDAESASQGRAGLGLAIVDGIVAAHHGEVTVQNTPGGCRFDVLLPPHPEPVGASGRSRCQGSDHGRPQRRRREFAHPVGEAHRRAPAQFGAQPLRRTR